MVITAVGPDLNPLHCFVGSTHRLKFDGKQAAEDKTHESTDKRHECRALDEAAA